MQRRGHALVSSARRNRYALSALAALASALCTQKRVRKATALAPPPLFVPQKRVRTARAGRMHQRRRDPPRCPASSDISTPGLPQKRVQLPLDPRSARRQGQISKGFAETGTHAKGLGRTARRRNGYGRPSRHASNRCRSDAQLPGTRRNGYARSFGLSITYTLSVSASFLCKLYVS